jgi:hypothetical protein
MNRHKKVFLILAVVLWLSSGCRPARDPVPDHLIGTWQTSSPTHTGSTFEITKQLVVFASDRGGDLRARIVGFKSAFDGTRTVYQLSYQDGHKNEYQLFLLYDATDGGTVTFKNQPQLVWKRIGVIS